MTYRLDIKAFLRSFGTYREVAATLTGMGLPVGPRTPEKWAQRGSIDDVYVANLIAHAAVSGRVVDLADFIVRADAPRLPRRPLAQ